MRWILPIFVLFTACTPDFEEVLATPQEVLPAMPDGKQAQEDCAKCALAKCRDELNACKNGCDDVRQCKTGDGKNSPDKQIECEEDADEEDLENYNRYRDCVFKYECKNDCNGGHNFACRRDYSWRDERTNIGIDLTIEVRQIADLLEGDGLTAPGEAGVWITPKFTREKGPTDDYGKIVYSSFYDDGFWPIKLCRPKGCEGRTQYVGTLGPLIYYIDRTINVKRQDNEKQSIIVYIPQRAIEIQQQTNEESGALTAMVYDCLGIPSSGVKLSLEDDSSNPGLYWGIDQDGNQSLKSNIPHEVPTIGGFYGLNGDEEKTIVASYKDGEKEKEIARKTVPISPKSTTFIALYPSRKVIGNSYQE
jgi:hypothetical protein